MRPAAEDGELSEIVVGVTGLRRRIGRCQVLGIGTNTAAILVKIAPFVKQSEREIKTKGSGTNGA